MNMSHTDSTENTNVEPTSSLLYELFKNTNSSNDMRMWSLPRLCCLSFFKNTNSSNDTNKEPNSALYERKNNKYNRYNKYNRRKIMLRIF